MRMRREKRISVGRAKVDAEAVRGPGPSKRGGRPLRQCDLECRKSREKLFARYRKINANRGGYERALGERERRRSATRPCGTDGGESPGAFNPFAPWEGASPSGTGRSEVTGLLFGSEHRS